MKFCYHDRAQAALFALIALPLATHAQSSATYDIARSSIDAGGGAASSASYQLQGTVGQPDANPTATSPSYELTGGFQIADRGAQADPIFRDGFE
jgi:hypothetical protein